MNYVRIVLQGGHTGSAFCFFSGVFATLATAAAEAGRMLDGVGEMLARELELTIELYEDGRRTERASLWPHVITEDGVKVDLSSFAMEERHSPGGAETYAVVGLDGQLQRQALGWVGDLHHGDEARAMAGLVQGDFGPLARKEQALRKLERDADFDGFETAIDEEVVSATGNRAWLARLFEARSRTYASAGSGWLAWADGTTARILTTSEVASPDAGLGDTPPGILLRPFVLANRFGKQSFAYLEPALELGAALATHCPPLAPELTWLRANMALTAPALAEPSVPQLLVELEVCVDERPASALAWSALARACAKAPPGPDALATYGRGLEAFVEAGRASANGKPDVGFQLPPAIRSWARRDFTSLQREARGLEKKRRKLAKRLEA